MTSVTLDSVVEAFGHWRKTKKGSGHRQIPPELWDMVFALEDRGLSPSIIKGALSISAHQYHLQKEKRQHPAPAISSVEASSVDKSADAESPPARFVEAKVEPASDVKISTAAKTVKAVKSNHKNEAWLSNETVVVECLRPDGYQLKIHITNKRIQEILNAFFQADYPATQSC